MIQKLDNSNKEIAIKIRSVFQASYKIEAEILGVSYEAFPPLNRPLNQFIDGISEFYGKMVEGQLAAVIEIKVYEDHTRIQSLVVHPDHFRKGFGRQLTQFVLDTFDAPKFIVETGLGNDPAINLYQKLGFREVSQYDTEIGVIKVRLSQKK